MRKNNNFVMGSFTLSKEHLELSYIAGINQWELVDQYLDKIESDFQLEEGSLIVYYYEGNKDYKEYWYTEVANTKYIINFELKLYSFGKVNPVDN